MKDSVEKNRVANGQHYAKRQREYALDYRQSLLTDYLLHKESTALQRVHALST